MKLQEAAAKHLLRGYGVSTPVGVVVTTPDEVRDTVGSIGPAMVKAQVPAGGRGKAGGVLSAPDAASGQRAAEILLGSTLGNDVVSEVLVEEFVDIASELYLSVMIDTSAGCPVVMVSPRGGIHVEDTPEEFTRLHL
ncbi:MAG: succinate--CoA ligase subunit beta, partial [Actinomycetia bacterium]|nr:succinate--CoA ligase subunit beta [Actinomycetes bacterium]